MKNLYYFLILVSVSIQAQFKPAFEMKISLNKNILASPQVAMDGITRFSNLVPDPNKTSYTYGMNSSSPDSTKYSKYGNLLDDNPLYNEKSSLWEAALLVTLPNTSVFLIDRYIFNHNFSICGI